MFAGGSIAKGGACPQAGYCWRYTLRVDYMMKRYSVTIAIITILLSACCPMVSINPLSPPAGLDKRLEGVWKLDSKEGYEVYLHIGEKSENIMLALSVEHKEDGKLDIINIPFFLSKTNKNNYLNLRLEHLVKEVAEENKGFIFLKYVFADNKTLLLYQLDQQLIISAIQGNKLKGKLIYKKKKAPKGTKSDATASQKTINCVVITDTSNNMINFFESRENDKLFADTMKFIRVK